MYRILLTMYEFSTYGFKKNIKYTCFVYEACVFYVLVVRPVLISFTIIFPTEVLYAPPYYL